MAQSENEERIDAVSDTLVPKTSRTTRNASKRISRDDKLQMLQACLNKVDAMRGVSVQRTTIHSDGKQTAAIVVIGCMWDDAGNLVFNAGNAGNREGK